MNRVSTNFTVKLLAAFLSFGMFMLVLFCAAGMIFSYESSSSGDSALTAGTYSQMIQDDMWQIVNQSLTNNEHQEIVAGSTNLRFVLLIDNRPMISNLSGLPESAGQDEAVAMLETVAGQSVIHVFGQFPALNPAGGDIAYQYYAGIDLSLPAVDHYSEHAGFINQLKPLITWSTYLMLPSVLIFIFLIIWQARATGMAVGRKDAALTFIDRIYSDVFTGFALLFGLLYVYFFYESAGYFLSSFDRQLPLLLVVTSLLCLPLYFLALVWFLSICRRIKAGVLFRGSLVAGIFKGVVRLFRWLANGMANLRSSSALVFLTICCFGAFLIIDSIFAVYLYRSFSAFLLAAGFNIAVLIFLCNTVANFARVARAAAAIAGGDLAAKADLHCLSGQLRQHAAVINNIGDGLNAAVAERLKSESFKTELIANVSHDLKTPLTSIINYIGLIKEQPDPEKNREYLAVLDRNAVRLKELTDDLLDFSKFSTGNIQLHLEKLDIGELIRQGVGEYEEKLNSHNLQVILNLPAEPVTVQADGRQIWRILENLLSNVRKYAQPGTRVYLDLFRDGRHAVWTTKNMSATPLNIPAEALLERFVRGDSSRHTEGSGLGLSIAKSLTELQGGQFAIAIDGDLFKTVITLPTAE